MKSLTDKIMSADIWNISGDFGRKSDVYSIKTNLTRDSENVYGYCGKLTNISDNKIEINCLKSRFHLGGGEFEVYTQHNIWQTESSGMWQSLNTEIGISTNSVRTSFGAAPFMAVWNKQTRRGIVFHLLADYAWSINLRLTPTAGEFAEAVAEIGINSEGFSYKLKPGESINTPDIIFYEFESKLDLDCRKLHNYCINNFKRRQMPIIYNTWLANFDNISYEYVSSQIEKAAKIGAEYFVIDAGWFGKGSEWGDSRGDWTENLTYGLRGRMSDISKEVNQNGMKFGLWFEIETASENSDIVKNHPEYFINFDGLFFLDFANEQAKNYILKALFDNIEKYKIEFLKLDFNQDMSYSRDAYISYRRGYESVIEAVREKYPDIYLENCASGGLRADLKNCSQFDSFWLSDNQSPYEGMRIFKEGIKRLPPQCIEKWAVVASMNGISPVYADNEKEKIISAHDATWNNVVGVHIDYLKGFLSGGPVGISCDLNKLSDKLISELAEHVKCVKTERSFWESAVCSILTDTDKLLVLEYSNGKQIKVIAYSAKVNQSTIFVYPHVDKNAEYLVGGKTASGGEIMENGIEIGFGGSYRSESVSLERK